MSVWRAMKIIHTSDWHIGREFENESLHADQSSFLSWSGHYPAASKLWEPIEARSHSCTTQNCRYRSGASWRWTSR